MSYSKQAISGFSWQTLMKIFAALISLIKISILARLLSPNDFGLFSLTVIALGLSEAAAQTGINVTNEGEFRGALTRIFSNKMGPHFLNVKVKREDTIDKVPRITESHSTEEISRTFSEFLESE